MSNVLSADFVVSSRTGTNVKICDVISPSIAVTSNSASTSTSTGSVVLAGGMGISGNLTVGGSIIGSVAVVPTYSTNNSLTWTGTGSTIASSGTIKVGVVNKIVTVCLLNLTFVQFTGLTYVHCDVAVPTLSRPPFLIRESSVMLDNGSVELPVIVDIQPDGGITIYCSSFVNQFTSNFSGVGNLYLPYFSVCYLIN